MRPIIIQQRDVLFLLAVRHNVGGRFGISDPPQENMQGGFRIGRRQLIYSSWFQNPGFAMRWNYRTSKSEIDLQMC